MLEARKRPKTASAAKVKVSSPPSAKSILLSHAREVVCLSEVNEARTMWTQRGCRWNWATRNFPILWGKHLFATGVLLLPHVGPRPQCNITQDLCLSIFPSGRPIMINLLAMTVFFTQRSSLLSPLELRISCLMRLWLIFGT